MTTDFKHIDILISRNLSGEASENEKLQLESWINESEGNRNYFNDYTFVYNKSLASDKQIKVDVDKAWNNLKSQMKPVSDNKISITTGKSLKLIRLWAQIAAIFILATGISYLIYQYFYSGKKGETVVLSGKDNTLNYTLSDNSQVFLNKKSKITYSSKFGKKSRKVILTGEAYFNVRHLADKPFIVKAEGAFVKDIGTSFNIKAYPDKNIIEVYVESGKISFYSDDNPGILLNQGETGFYNKTTKSFGKYENTEANILSYKTKIFVFQNTTLTEVIEKLSSAYGLNIKLRNVNLMNCRITVTFDNENIEHIIKIITETLGLQSIKSSDGYILYGNGCISQ